MSGDLGGVEDDLGGVEGELERILIGGFVVAGGGESAYGSPGWDESAIDQVAILPLDEREQVIFLARDSGLMDAEGLRDLASGDALGGLGDDDSLLLWRHV